jgi:hypothetical protein
MNLYLGHCNQWLEKGIVYERMSVYSYTDDLGGDSDA